MAVNYSENEYVVFCDHLEKEYKQFEKQGLFEILRIINLDTEHSDPHLVQAIDYFNERDGIVEKDAPMEFLTQREKNMVQRDGQFRAALYCMFLSEKFSEAIQNKSAFVKHSLKYGFNSVDI